MATKSNKNILTIIVISSVLLFIAAIYWKQTNQSNAEVVNLPNNTNTPKINNTKQDDLSFLEEDYTESSSTTVQEPQNNEERRRKLSNIMQMSMMYKTPEQVMESVVYYQDKGNDEKVNELINFLIERFPDYQLPDNI
ncbi:MAG: hypothetical protein JKX98_04745 [Alcanivoracaceae bacterium]|nr:hypothetical protein [Alcanivoracaceae bacterium]